MILVAFTYWNLWSFSVGVGRLPAREYDPVVAWEDKFLRIHYALITEDYHSGNIEYVTARSLRGEPRTVEDDLHWFHLKYVAIPLNLVRNMPDTPYVLGDFTSGDPIPEVPEGLTKLHDSGNGLILYKRNASQ
jgi:hypothetical protein